MKKYFELQYRELSSLIESASEKNISFYTTMIVAGSSALAILASLFKGQDCTIVTNIIYLVLSGMLSLCVLSSFIVLHDYKKAYDETARLFKDEFFNALDESRELKECAVFKKKRTKALQLFVQISFIFSILLLPIYIGFCAFA